MTTTKPVLLMTMSDIAALARVQRPVVSVWRTRAAKTDAPFPSSITHQNGRELFDARQVGAWLSDTHRGNNPEAVADATAHAALENSAQTTESSFRAVTALLALHSSIGGPLGALSAGDLLDAADEHDPDDDMFYREIDGIGDERGSLADYVDDLVEAAYGEAAAFERLMADRFRLDLRDLGDTALNGPARELMAQTATALAATQQRDPVFVDATGSASDIILAIAHAEHASRDLTVVTANDDSDAARLLRRRMLVHRITRAGLDVLESGAFTVTGAAVHVAQFPPASNAVMSPTAMLSAIDQIVLQMDDAQLAAVIAPSSVLSDASLNRETDELRSVILRSGRVRAIVRLPTGLVPHKPQQAQTLWVLGAAHKHVQLTERWTLVADLNAIRFEPAVIDDLVSDLVASLGDRVTVRAHAFRFARLVLTRTLLASRDSLVAGARSGAIMPTMQGAALAVRVDELLSSLNRATPALITDTDAASSLARLAIEPRSQSSRESPTRPATPSTVEQLVAARHLRYIPGNRLEVSDIVPGDTGAAGIPIIAPAEVLGEYQLGARRIDRLRFAAGYPAGRLTEPGDVVFCTAPRPTAIVDVEGTSVVVFPARILRINHGDPNGLLGEVLAADVAALMPGDRRWRRWQLRKVQHQQRRALAEALASVRLEQERARERLARLDELRDLLMVGVTAGTLTLLPASAPIAPETPAPLKGTH